jgi:predicted TIM-barrel fold metal-dependent hydrolase
LLATIDSAGVDAACVVQAIGAYGYDCSYAIDAVAAAPDRLALVVAVDMAGDDPPSALAELVNRAPVRAVRVFGVGSADPAWLTNGRGLAIWETARDLGIGTVPTLWGRDLPALRTLIETFPDVAVAIDHCGFPDLGDQPPYADLDNLLGLADLPAVHLKVSTHVLEPLDEPADLIDVLAETFGAGRLSWGSDHPQTHSMTYAAMVDLGRRAARRLAPVDQETFLAGTARKLWFEP